jgi:WD40 repeat protein
LRYSPDGQTIAIANENGSLQLWTPAGDLIANLPDHEARIWNVSFSADGQVFATASEDGTVRLWSQTGSLIQVFRDDAGRFRRVGEIHLVDAPDLPLDQLLASGCAWLKDYLRTYPQLEDRDRQLCL